MDPVSVIVLGSINADLIVRGRRLPRPGETIVGGVFFRARGGKGANQAVAAARAGIGEGICHVALIGAIGDDDLGRDALTALAREGLIVDDVKIVAGEPTGVALILVDAAGENLIGVASGANSRLRPDDVDAVPDQLFAQATVFLASLETPRETVARGLARARQAGLTTILNPAPAPDDAVGVEWISSELLPLVDVLTPNEHEAAALSGMVVCDAAAAEAAARRLLERGCKAVVVTLGPQGAVLVEPGKTLHVPAPTVAAIDATAAGDAFNGALAVAMCESRPLADAVRFACRAATLSVTKAGAQPSLPTRAEIDNT
ncbi:MAG: ribokinase [Planctomycetia bacterium]|nr:ribokinase [Planctomycetia bacterium]